MNELLTCAVM